jgi:DnaJ-class molecular chaperone
MEKCSKCKGTGLIDPHKNCLNPLTCKETKRCAACEGLGRVETEKPKAAKSKAVKRR